MNHGNKLAAAGYATDAPAPMHPVPAALESLVASINGLAVTADMIAGRLGYVMLPGPGTPPPATSGTNLHAVASRSPLADQIENQRQRIENIAAGLQDVLNRLEV